jgi:hypothetical protein
MAWVGEFIQKDFMIAGAIASQSWSLQRSTYPFHQMQEGGFFKAAHLAHSNKPG